MTWLALGLLIFLGIHCLPHFQTSRHALIERFGPGGHKGLFSLVSGIGFTFIIIGVIQRSHIPLWIAPEWSRDLAIGGMLPASILLCAANFPNNIQRLSKNPMLIGLIIWSAVHLIANGDLASLMLFGGFLLFALFDIWSVTRINRASANNEQEKTALWRDVLVIALGAGIYSALLIWHGNLFGVTVIHLQ